MKHYDVLYIGNYPYLGAAAPAAADLPASAAELFGSFHMGNYHPVTMLSLATDLRLFRGDPRGSVLGGALSTSQLIALAGLAAAAGIAWWGRTKTADAPA